LCYIIRIKENKRGEKMENSKKILVLILGLAMVLGVTPAFAAEPYTTGTSNAEIGK
jgi:hypothetical protein